MPRPLEKILLITKVLEADPAGGRELLCKLNHGVLLSSLR